jgi:hypothetical protein
MAIRGVVSVRASPPPPLEPQKTASHQFSIQCANETGKGKNIPLLPLMVTFLAFGSCSSKPAS